MADGPLQITARLVALLIATLVLGTALALASQSGAAGLRPADWSAIRFTITQALVSTALSCALAVPTARALMRRTFPGRGLLIALLGAPFLLPVIVAVLGLLTIYGRSGVLNGALQAVGLPPISIYGMTGVVLAHVFFNLPLATRILLNGWHAIPAERFRLAETLGLPSAFRHIEAPMLRATLPGAALAIFLVCLTSFVVALTLGGGPRWNSRSIRRCGSILTLPKPPSWPQFSLPSARWPSAWPPGSPCPLALARGLTAG
jgi:thiamine transport system permease protein